MKLYRDFTPLAKMLVEGGFVVDITFRIHGAQEVTCLFRNSWARRRLRFSAAA